MFSRTNDQVEMVNNNQGRNKLIFLWLKILCYFSSDNLNVIKKIFENNKKICKLENFFFRTIKKEKELLERFLKNYFILSDLEKSFNN